MEFISHRINTIDELINTPTQFGIELDLRDYGDKIILQHDPFLLGEDFEEYLKYYKHGTMILNVKSERIELRILDLLKKYNIKNYFFLDCSFPMIYMLSKLGEKNIALRFSEFEGLDTILKMKGKVNWVWVDCFTKLPLDFHTFNILKENNFNLCMVSPELQGQPEKINDYKEIMKKENIFFDAICTKQKYVETWDKN